MMMFVNTYGGRPIYSTGWDPNPLKKPPVGTVYRYLGDLDLGEVIIVIDEPKNGYIICLTKFGLGKTWADDYDPPYVPQ